MKNERVIIGEVLKNYPQFAKNEEEITEFVMDVFAAIVTTVWEKDKVCIKNVGTFEFKKRFPRRHFDQGLKEVVVTPPKKIVEFIQSNNIFRNEKE